MITPAATAQKNLPISFPLVCPQDELKPKSIFIPRAAELPLNPTVTQETIGETICVRGWTDLPLRSSSTRE